VKGLAKHLICAPKGSPIAVGLLPIGCSTRLSQTAISYSQVCNKLNPQVAIRLNGNQHVRLALNS